MSVLDEFLPYRNKFGMFPWNPSNPVVPNVSDNDTLYTSWMIMACLDSGTPIEHLLPLKEAYAAYLTDEGATKRTPDSGALDSGDNLVGWGVASYYLNPEWAERILSYARANAWTWPSDENDSLAKKWLGRHRAMEAHLALASSRETPDFLMQSIWAIAVLMSLFARKGDGDAFNLSYCLVRVAHECKRTPRPMKIVAWIWKLGQALRKKNMSQNLGETYGWAGSPHSKYIK